MMTTMGPTDPGCPVSLGRSSQHTEELGKDIYAMDCFVWGLNMFDSTFDTVFDAGPQNSAPFDHPSSHS